MTFFLPFLVSSSALKAGFAELWGLDWKWAGSGFSVTNNQLSDKGASYSIQLNILLIYSICF